MRLMAIAPNGATGYVTDPGSDSVTPIDLATNDGRDPDRHQRLPTKRPSFIAITPNGATAYVTGGYVVWPIDLATDTVETPIPVEYAVNIAITPDGSTAYVTDPYDNVITPINIATNTTETPITTVSAPGALAITPDGSTGVRHVGRGHRHRHARRPRHQYPGDTNLHRWLSRSLGRTQRHCHRAQRSHRLRAQGSGTL